MKLYEITADYQDFLTAVENGEIPEEAIADTLESITALIDEKADNIACMLKNIDAECEAIKAEERRLAERRKAKESAYERIKHYLSDTLLRAGYTKIETPRNRISFRKSEQVQIDDESAFLQWAQVGHDELLTYQPPKINKTAIKKAISEGEEINGAYIVSKQNLQLK